MYIFDRYFKYFINKICGILIVVILILLAFFLGLWKADAAEIGYSNATYQAGNCGETTTTCTTTGHVPLGTGTTMNGIMNRLYFVVYGSDSIIYEEGNTYNFEFLVNLNPKNDFNTYDFNNSTIDWFGHTSTSGTNASSSYISNGTLKIENVTTGSQSNYQTKFTFSFTPTADLKYLFFRVNFPIVSSGCGSVSGLCPYYENSINVISLKITYESGVAGAINNQTNVIINNQNQNTDKVIDNITNSDTTNSESEGAGFFNDFQVNDNGGISGIITAPLTLINGLVSGNNKCNNLNFNMAFLGKSKGVSLPSGCIMWQKAPQAAVTTYQMLVCGLLSYILMINLYKDIEDLKNPKDEEVDTLDL